jgi:hypothetical protein
MPRLVFTEQEKADILVSHRRQAYAVLTSWMDKAGLFPAAQARLRKAFLDVTNTSGMREAVATERALQSCDNDRYHREHAAEYLEACGIKLEDLKTDGVQ